MKSIRTSCWIALSVLFAVACGDRKDPAPASNFKYDGKTYELNVGYYESYGANGDGSYDMDIFLMAESSDSTSSTLDGVYLDLNTSSAEGLVAGTYTFAEERKAFSMVDGSVSIHYNTVDETGDEYGIVGGTVEIAGTGSTYEITFDLTLDNSKQVTGTYKGKLLPFE
ncbi:hypothetical protein SAMN05421823_10850 [Catalinimonas alkaloidigena]|uniref:Uncharacterized protein n=1 Tax=Catalinimonas alkaloidigena TaxID=1075417 RepID=A0A1G9MPJ2_9BACT|nr:hypothetical protein [Catalinimonas alkaloidigena]SDL76212.1 hypothetical protein SAMN05421823_10850 [Catalinimonas alkaloidigena]